MSKKATKLQNDCGNELQPQLSRLQILWCPRVTIEEATPLAWSQQRSQFRHFLLHVQTLTDAIARESFSYRLRRRTNIRERFIHKQRIAFIFTSWTNLRTPRNNQSTNSILNISRWEVNNLRWNCVKSISWNGNKEKIWNNKTSRMEQINHIPNVVKESVQVGPLEFPGKFLLGRNSCSFFILIEWLYYWSSECTAMMKMISFGYRWV